MRRATSGECGDVAGADFFPLGGGGVDCRSMLNASPMYLADGVTRRTDKNRL